MVPAQALESASYMGRGKMPNQNKSQIAVVLDRSGSMGSIVKPTIEGFNEFVKGQVSGPDQAQLKLIQFDHDYMTVYNVPIKDAPLLTSDSYVPRGTTALLDAIGRCITELGGDLSQIDEAERPANVIVVIITDGLENASKTYTREKVFEMIEHQQNIYKWQFMFLAANQDAIQVGDDLGINTNAAMTYTADWAGTQATYAAVSSNVIGARGGQHVNFTPQQRQAAVTPDKTKR